MVDVMRSNMLLSSSVLHWQQRQSALWPLALGSVLGLGIGAGALWGIRGLIRGCGVSGSIRHGMLVRQRCRTGAGWRGHDVYTSGGVICYSVEAYARTRAAAARTPRDGRTVRRNLLDGLARY